MPSSTFKIEWGAVLVFACALFLTATAAAASFTDPTLIAGTTPIRAIHFTELRARIDTLRSQHLLPVYSYGNSINAGSSIVQAIDVTQMRKALQDVYNAIPQTAPVYSTSPAAGVAIVVADIAELRSAVTAIEPAPFNVVSAASIHNTAATVTFDAPPNQGQATNVNNYSIPGLIVSAASLNGNVATLTTSAQSASVYTVTVSGVTRASDGVPLAVNAASFSGTVNIPNVTNVVVISTNPDNGTTPYNTGTATVRITGTDFGTVACPGGVKLDDRDGAGVLVATTPTICTVDGDSQITATFPAGIRTNGSTGWNVTVTNMAGSNTTSVVKLAPGAGLLISEVLIGGSQASHEFIEVYNPTTSSIDGTSSGVALHLHIRNGVGDTDKVLTAVTTGVIPSHGFLLIASVESTIADLWFPHSDYTYSATVQGLSADGGAYLSLSATNNAKVIDKLGWGSQPAGGFEGTAVANIVAGNSVQRKPAGSAGAATDTDNNLADFNAQSTLITPLGTVDPPQP